MIPLLAERSSSLTSGEAWVVIVFFGLVNGINVWGVRRQWQGRRPSFPDGPKPAMLFAGDATWHGMGRIYPLMTAWGYLSCVPIGFAFAVSEPGGGLPFWLPGGFGLVASAVICVLVVSVHFFNFPRWVVAPHRRAEPGAIREWRDARRDRREAEASDDSSTEAETST